MVATHLFFAANFKNYTAFSLLRDADERIKHSSPEAEGAQGSTTSKNHFVHLSKSDAVGKRDFELIHRDK
jgi:hypothetical protein